MKLHSKIMSAMPGAGRILFWVLPIWFIGFLTVMGRVRIMGAVIFVVSWFLICGLITYVTRNKRIGGASETLEEKGWHIRGGVLRR